MKVRAAASIISRSRHSFQIDGQLGMLKCLSIVFSSSDSPSRCADDLFTRDDDDWLVVEVTGVASLGFCGAVSNESNIEDVIGAAWVGGVGFGRGGTAAKVSKIDEFIGSDDGFDAECFGLGGASKLSKIEDECESGCIDLAADSFVLDGAVSKSSKMDDGDGSGSVGFGGFDGAALNDSNNDDDTMLSLEYIGLGGAMAFDDFMFSSLAPVFAASPLYVGSAH